MTANGRKRAEAPVAPLSSFHSVTGPGWTMYRGDCLKVLAAMPDKSVHVTLTDPPYEVEAHTLQRRVKRDAGTEIAEEPLNFEPITAADRIAVASHIARITQHRALAFCQAEAIAAWRDAFNEAGLPYRRSIPWVKPDAMPSLHGRYPGQSFESIVLAQFPSAPACPMGGGARSYRVNKSTSNGSPHPTTKPDPLMALMVEDFTDMGDVVLDPYCGSGSTGVACIRLGRTFIGIERDPAYFEIACRRLRGDEAKPRKEQPSLFDAIGATP